MSAPGWCRDCYAPAPPEGARCPSCGGRRLVRHPELARLAIAHLDCDAFYASVEKRDDPALADKPVIVGGGRRGVVTTACYIARAFGVRSAMPMFKALAACPDAVVIKPRMSVYVAESRRIRALLDALTPLVQPLSIDEAFLDLSGLERLHGAPPVLMLMKLQARIEAQIGITVSIGLAPNKFLAKLASDLDKPRGFAVIGREDAMGRLAPLRVDALPGVGPAFAATLKKAGYAVIGDLQRAEPRALAARFGEQGQRLARLARAEDARPVASKVGRKTISAETTFEEDIKNPDALADILWRLCVRVSDRAKEAGLMGRVATLKLKRADHAIRGRRRSLSSPIQLADSLFRATEPLLRAEANGERFRLIGAGLSDLEPGEEAPGDLVDAQAPRRAAAERAMDTLRARYGPDAVGKGRGRRWRDAEEG